MGWEGKILECIIKGDLIIGLCLEEKKEKLKILNLKNKEISLTARKALHKSSFNLNIRSSRDVLLANLKEANQRREEIKATIHLGEIWEVLYEEESSGYTSQDLSELYFDKEDDDHVGAMVRALYNNSMYFKRQKHLFIPQSKKAVENLLQKEKNLEKIEENRKAIGSWLQEIWNSPNTPSIPKEPLLETVVEQLKAIVLEKATPKVSKMMEGYFEEANIPFKGAPFRLLRKLDIFSENENFSLLRLGIPVEFSSQILETTEQLLEKYNQIFLVEKSSRKTYPDLSVFAIDEATTHDRDDALSLEIIPSGYRLGIHIADVASLIELDSPMEKVALERGTSIYMADQTIEMLPKELTRIFSLDESKEKLTLSIFVDLDEQGKVLKYTIQETCLKINHNYSYDQVEEKINQEDPTFSKLYKLAQNIFEKRIENGGKHIFFPFLNLSLEENGDISIEKIQENSKSQFLVSECMILGNHLFASFLHKYGLVGIFRGQPEVKGFVPLEKVDALSLYGVRKFLKKTFMSLQPEKHFTLGLEEYLQGTSPIRRYADILNHYQIKSILKSEDSLDEKEVQQKIHKLTLSLEQARQVSRERQQFWIFKFLEGLAQHVFPALVLNYFGNHKFLVQIHDEKPDLEDLLPSPHFYESVISYRGSQKIQPGDWIQVSLSKIDVHQRTMDVHFDSLEPS